MHYKDREEIKVLVFNRRGVKHITILIVAADVQTYKTDVALEPHLRCATEYVQGYPVY